MPEFLVSPSVTPLAANRLVFTDTGGKFAVSTALDYDPAGASGTGRLTLTIGVITNAGTFQANVLAAVAPSNSNYALYAENTWNNAGTVQKLIYAAVTDTASAAGSTLIDLGIGATSKFKVDKTGAGTLVASLTTPSLYGDTASAGNIDLFSTSHATKGKVRLGGGTVCFFDEAASTFNLGAGCTLNSLLGTITTNKPHLNGTVTWNGSGVDMTGVKLAFTDTASGIDSSLVNLTVGGTSKFRVDKYGNVQANSFSMLANTACYRTRSWQAQQNAAATTISMIGFATAPTATGTATVISNTNLGEYINYSSAATTNADAGWKWTAETTRLRWSPTLTVKVRPAATITTERCWVGLFSADPMAQDTPHTGAILAAGFRFSTNVPDTNWQAVTSDGTTTTVTDTGIAYAASTTYLLAVDFSDNGTTARFSINGVTVATVTATLPASTTALMPYVQVRTLANAARDIMLSTVLQESE